MRRAAIMAVLAIFAAVAAGAQAPDEERIFTFIKGTPAKELDSALPKMRFERWLLDVVGKGVELRWSINDCGEQSGEPEADAKRDLPICAGVNAELDKGRAFQILLAIGTQKKGIGGKPKLYSVIVQANRRMLDVKRLRDLPKALDGVPPGSRFTESSAQLSGSQQPARVSPGGVLCKSETIPSALQEQLQGKRTRSPLGCIRIRKGIPSEIVLPHRQWLPV